jgi:hypothetical protein
VKHDQEILILFQCKVTNVTMWDYETFPEFLNMIIASTFDSLIKLLSNLYHISCVTQVNRSCDTQRCSLFLLTFSYKQFFKYLFILLWSSLYWGPSVHPSVSHTLLESSVHPICSNVCQQCLISSHILVTINIQSV